jgi:broad specificity phosphatase PhoE
MSLKRVVFIRPGETEWNRMGRWQGYVNIPLNEHGKQQARRLAQFIRPIGIEALYTSDLRRALDTAQILGETLGFTAIADVRLRERHIGLWQGLTVEEVQAWYPEEYAELLKKPTEYVIPGGESRVTVAQRMKAAFDDILAQTTALQTIGIVTHTTAIRALMSQISPRYDALGMQFANMSVTSIAQQADQTWQVIQKNEVIHLQGMETAFFPELEQQK